MSTEATGAAAPGTHHNNLNVNLHDHEHDLDDSTIAVVNPQPATKSPKPTGLHSPPDSNNVDASDSELSDLDEAIADADSPNATPAPASTTAPKTANSHPNSNNNNNHDDSPAPTADFEQKDKAPEQAPTPGQDEDIGEVLPDHWSGTVPVFKPTMHQFKDFKKFVCHLTPHLLSPCLRVATLHSNTRLHRCKLSIPTV